MGKINGILTEMNTRIGALSGVTCQKGLVRFPESGTPLEDLIAGLAANGVEALVYLSCSAGLTNPTWRQGGSTIFTAQMAIRLESVNTVDLSTYYDLVESIYKAMMLEDNTDPNEILGADWRPLPMDDNDNYRWTIFEFEYNVTPC